MSQRTINELQNLGESTDNTPLLENIDEPQAGIIMSNEEEDDIDPELAQLIKKEKHLPQNRPTKISRIEEIRNFRSSLRNKPFPNNEKNLDQSTPRDENVNKLSGKEDNISSSKGQIKKQQQIIIEAWNEGINKKRLIRLIAFGPFYLAFIIGAILLMAFHSFTLHPFVVGSWRTSQNLNFNLNISNCLVHIRDIDSSDGSTNVMKLQRLHPWFSSEHFIIQGGTDEDGTVALNLVNPYVAKYCNLTLFINPAETIGNFALNCSSCVMIQDTPIFNVGGTTTINGLAVSANLAYLNTNSFSFLANQGFLQVNMINTYSDDDNNIAFTQKGDIILQSDSTINIKNFTSPSATCCFAGQTPLNIQSTPCDEANPNAQGGSCGNGRVFDSAKTDGANQKFNLYTKQGNIYCNVIPGIQQPISPTVSTTNNTEYLFFSPSYTGIDFDNSTKNQLSIFDDLVMNPTINVPILALNLGDSASLSSTWSKWILASNSTYEYIKPWVLAGVSASLLEGYPYEINGQLLPGFCPWRPTLSADDYFNIIGLLDTYKASMDISGDASFVYSSVFNPSSAELVNYTTSSGIYNQINNWVPWEDNWYTLIKDKVGDIAAVNHKIQDNTMGFLALILSIFCALLLGIVAVAAIIYIINHYSYIIVSKGSKQSAYININKIRSKDISSEEKAALRISVDNKNLKAPPNTINPIKNLQYIKNNCVCISTLIDYFVVNIARKEANSINSFFDVIFVEESNANQFYDDDGDTIDFEEFQNYYQQYCFLNHLTEESLEIKSIGKLLNEKGFMVDAAEDAIIFCGIILKDKKDIDLRTVDHELQSLTYFMKHCVEQTKFMQDTVEAREFTERYTDFCKSYRLQAMLLNPKTLKQSYGIETSTVSKYLIRKIKGTQKEKNYIINRRNLAVHLQYLFNETATLSPQAIKQVRENLCSQENYVFELLIILLQYGFLLILIFPVILWIILISTAYAPYTMKNAFYLLDWQSFYYQPIVAFTHLPYLVQCFLIFMIICNGLDLIFYIRIMERPIESYFKNTKWSDNTIGRIIAFGNWIIVFILIFIYTSFLALIMIWTLLGTIINPTYMLPYATATFTFITFATAKFKQFSDEIENVKNSILQIIEKAFSGNISKILMSMGINLINRENKVLEKAKDIVNNKGFGETTLKLVEEDIISKNDVESVLKKIQDLSTHDSSKNEFDIADDIENHPHVLNAEFEKLSKTLEKKYISKLKKNLIDKECKKELINLAVCHTTKQTEDLKTGIFDFLKSLDSEISEPMKSFLSEVLFSSPSTVREKNIKYLAIKLIQSILEKLNDSEQTNFKISNSLVRAYYSVKTLEKEEWSEFINNIALLIKKNEILAKHLIYNKNSMKLILSSLNMVSVFIKKYSSNKEIAENFNYFINALKTNKSLQFIFEKNKTEIDEDALHIEGQDQLDADKDKKIYYDIYFQYLCECLLNFISILKNNEVIWNYSENNIASTEDIYNFALESVILVPIANDLLKYTNNSSNIQNVKLGRDFLQYFSKTKPRFGGAINISLGLLRNDLPNIHSKSILSLIETYDLKLDENNEYVSSDYVKSLLELYSLSLTSPKEFIKQAFDYRKENVSDEWKEFILYSLTFKYTTLITSSKISYDNKFLNIFLRKLGLTFSNFMGILHSMTDQISYTDTNFFVDLIIDKLNIPKLSDSIRHFLRNVIRLLMTQKQEVASECIMKLKLPLKKFIMVGKGIMSIDCIKHSDYNKLIKFCWGANYVNDELITELKQIPKTSLQIWKYKLLEILGRYDETTIPDPDEHKNLLGDENEDENENWDSPIKLIRVLLHMVPKNQKALRDVWMMLVNSMLVIDNSYHLEDNQILTQIKNDNQIINNLLLIISLKLWMIKNGEYPQKVDKNMMQTIAQFSELLAIDSNNLLNAFQLFLIDDKTYHSSSLEYFFSDINLEGKEFVEYAYQRIGGLKNYSKTLLVSLPNILKWSQDLVNKVDNKIDMEIPGSWCKTIRFNQNTNLELAEIQESFQFINKVMKTSSTMSKYAENDFEQSTLYREIYFLGKLYKGMSQLPKYELNDPLYRIKKSLTYLLSTSQKPKILAELMKYIPDKKNRISICLTIYAILRGWGRNFKIDHNISFNQLAGEQFNIKSEFFDIFEAIFKKDISSYIESCSRIIKQLNGSNDKQFKIAMLSFLNNQHTDLSPISKKIGYSLEILEFITTLYSVKTPCYRSSALTLMESSLIIQNKLKELDIDHNEFISMLRIIFSEYNEKSTLDQTLKVLDPKKFVDFRFVHGINEIFHYDIDPQENMENLVKSNKKLYEYKMKLIPLFEVLDLDPTISLIMLSLRSGNFLILENQIQDFEWVFGQAKIDYQENIIQISEAGRNILYLTEGLAGLVNTQLKFINLPPNAKVPKTNSLNYAQHLFSNQLDIDSKWLDYGIHLSNADQTLFDYAFDQSTSNLLGICLLYNTMNILSVQKDVLGLNDWHAGMIYYFNYDMLNKVDELTYIQVLDKLNDTIKTLTIKLFIPEESKQICSIVEQILKVQYNESKLNLEISNLIFSTLLKIKALPVFQNFVQENYPSDAKILDKLDKLRNKEIVTSPAETFKILDHEFANNRAYILLIKCLIPYIYEMMWGNKSEDEALKVNRTAFLDIAIISGIMEIRNIKFNQAEYTYNLFSLNILMTNIERKLIFIDYEMTKLYRKFAIMKLVGLSRGIIISNAFEMFLSPPVINIWILNKYRFFNYKKIQRKSQEEIDQLEFEANAFFALNDIKKSNFDSNPEKLIHEAFTCTYCLVKASPNEFKDPLQGIRYRCKKCDEIDLCSKCMKEIDEISKGNARFDPQIFTGDNKYKKDAYKLKDHAQYHESFSIHTFLDKISKNHLIRTYGEPNTGCAGTYQSHGDEVYGELVEKFFWSEIWMSKLRFDKSALFDPHIFAANIDHLVERIKDFELYGGYIDSFLMFEVKKVLDEKHIENLYSFLTLGLKNDEKILLYPSFEIKWQKIIKKIEIICGKDSSIKEKFEKNCDIDRDDQFFNERFSDLRTNIQFKALESKIKDFESTIMKQNAIMLMNLYDNKFDFANTQEKNYLTDRNKESLKAYKLIIELLRLNMNRNMSSSNYLLNIEGSYIASDPKSLNQLLGFLISSQGADSVNLECIKRAFNINQQVLNNLNICSDYIKFRAENIEGKLQNQELTTNKIRALMEKMFVKKETIDIIILLHSIYNLNLDSWEDLANKFSLTKDNPNVKKLMNIISCINLKAFDNYLHSENSNEAPDWTKIPNIIHFADTSINNETDLLRFILEKYSYEKDKPCSISENEIFSCNVLNRILNSSPGYNDGALIDLFIPNYQDNIQELDYQKQANDFITNYYNLIDSLIPNYQNYSQSEDKLKIEINNFAWLLYLKKSNFKSLDQKVKYANIIFSAVSNDPSYLELDRRKYFLAFIGYIKWDFELILNCIDENTESYALLSSLYLLLNWNRVLNHIYVNHEENFSKEKINGSNSNTEENKGLVNYIKKILKEEICPLIDYYSVIFAFSFVRLNSGANPLMKEAVTKSMKKMRKNIPLFKEWMRKIELSGSENESQSSKNINKNISKLRTHIVQAQFDEKFRSIFASSNNDDSSKKRDANLNQLGQENEENPDPFGQDNQENEDPFGQGNEENADPFGQDNQENVDPFGQDNQENADPFGQDNQENEDPFGQDNQENEDPFGQDNQENVDPLGQRNEENPNPLRQDNQEDPDPFGQNDEDPFGQNEENPAPSGQNDKKENDENEISDDEDQGVQKDVTERKKAGFKLMVKGLFSLQDFYLLNFDEILHDNPSAKDDWIYFNNYLILAEHYNPELYFDPRLKTKADDHSVATMPSEIKYIINFLINFARNCCNSFNKSEKNNLQILADVMKLMLDDLCSNIPNNDQKNFKDLIIHVIELFSVVSGYNFIDKFTEEVQLDNNAKEMENLGSRLSKAMNKIIEKGDITNVVLASSLRREYLDKLIPLLIGIKHNPKDDTWSVPQDDASDKLNEKNNLQNNDIDKKDHVNNDDDQQIHENAKSDVEKKEKKEIIFGQYKIFQDELFKLVQILSIKFKQSIFNNSAIPEILKNIFNILESIFSQIEYIPPADSTHICGFNKEMSKVMSKDMNKLGKLVIALYKLNFGDIDSFETLLNYTFKEKEKVTNVMEYIKDTSQLVDLNDFKEMTKIPTTQTKSKSVENMKKLFTKIKNDKATEHDLFKLCDYLGDGSGGIGIDEFSILARRMGIPLTKHRLQEIYTEIKGQEISSVQELDLDIEEFAKALLYLKEQQVLKALEFMGITPEIMYATLAYLLLILLIIFSFIFLGIKAFAIGGGFSAVVNSALPVITALGLSGKNIKKKKGDEKDVKEACEKSKAVITKTHQDKENQAIVYKKGA